MMMEDATGYGNVEAWVARGRMREMMARGWRAMGPIRDDAVLMSGPNPDDDAPMSMTLDQAAMGLAAVRRVRTLHAQGMERLVARGSEGGRRHVA